MYAREPGQRHFQSHLRTKIYVRTHAYGQGYMSGHTRTDKDVCTDMGHTRTGDPKTDSNIDGLSLINVLNFPAHSMIVLSCNMRIQYNSIVLSYSGVQTKQTKQKIVALKLQMKVFSLFKGQLECMEVIEQQKSRLRVEAFLVSGPKGN